MIFLKSESCYIESNVLLCFDDVYIDTQSASVNTIRMKYINIIGKIHNITLFYIHGNVV